jgi:hypothetical protein
MHDGIMRDLGIVVELDKLPFSFKTVLDVGGTHNTYSKYCLDKDFSILNIENYSVNEKIKFYQASILDMPFEENHFDVVITNDTLEHIPRNQRKKAISELIRIAKKGVIIGVPCGNTTKKYEKFVLKLGLWLKRDMRWLKEHEEAEISNCSEIINSIKNNKEVKNLSIIKNNNLNIWLLTSLSGPFMRFFWNRFDRPKLLKHWKYFNLLNFGKPYRKFFIIYK